MFLDASCFAVVLIEKTILICLSFKNIITTFSGVQINASRPRNSGRNHSVVKRIIAVSRILLGQVAPYVQSGPKIKGSPSEFKIIWRLEKAKRIVQIPGEFPVSTSVLWSAINDFGCAGCSEVQTAEVSRLSDQACNNEPGCLREPLFPNTWI